MIISAGVAKRADTRRADSFGTDPKAKVSAFHTRNAVLVFAVFGLFLILADTILHATRLINRLPAIFDTVVSKNTAHLQNSANFLPYKLVYHRHACTCWYIPHSRVS